MKKSLGSCYLTGTGSLFESLDSEVLDSISNKSRVYDFSRKDTTYEEFPIEGKVYIVHAGQVFLSYIDQDGKKIILDILSQGDIFGDLNFEKDSEHVNEILFIEPFTDSKICAMNKNAFKKILIANPEFAVSLLSKVANRLSNLEQKVGTLVFSDVETRIIAQLMQLSKTYGKETATTIYVGVRVTHEKLAEMIGSARETVSETISYLKKTKVLTQDKKHIFYINKNPL